MSNRQRMKQQISRGLYDLPIVVFAAIIVLPAMAGIYLYQKMVNGDF